MLDNSRGIYHAFPFYSSASEITNTHLIFCFNDLLFGNYFN